jgi:Uma2 family endonuclease
LSPARLAASRGADHNPDMTTAMTGSAGGGIATAELSDPDALYEVVDGRKVEVPPMGRLAGTLASVLISALNRFASERGLGLAVTEVLFHLRDGQPERRPDIAFVPVEHLDRFEAMTEDPAAWDVVPTLAVEVVSPSNSGGLIEAKRLEYFAAGVKAVWVVYPLQHTVHIFDAPDRARVIGLDGELDGGAALPGFNVRLADVFNPLRRPNPGA